MSKLVVLRPEKISVQALLHQVLEDSEVDGVIVVARRDGRWSTCWSTGINIGSLSMAALKLVHDTTEFMHEGGGEAEPEKEGA
jgi:hypothetical protein